MAQRQSVTPTPLLVQPSLKVSSPKDPSEREAETTARKIMRMAAPPALSASPSAVGTISRQLESPYVRRFAGSGIFRKEKPNEEKEKIQRKGKGTPSVTPTVAAGIGSSLGSGSPLPSGVRRFMEPRFGADFGKVRIHTGERSAVLNRKLNAQAFTVGNNIFFGRDSFRPDGQGGKELIAHELTHTIQQGGVVQRSADVSVSRHTSPMVQRLGLSDALDYFADKANMIPGFRMFTIILGVNPINMGRVERSAANILRAMVEFIPGGGLVTQALDNYGIFDKVGKWVEQQIASLGMTGAAIKQAVSQFLDSLGWRDILDLGGVWSRAKRIFTEPIDRLIGFGKGLISGILKFVKVAIVRPLAKLAEGTRGYDLLKAVLGEDPVTGDPVPQNADTLIGGFMKLIGQEEVWQNLKKSNTVGRAWAWFKNALSSLLGFVRQIPSLFIKTLQSLELADIVLLPRAFAKVAGVFGSFVGQFFSWAGNAVWNLLEIIFEVVAPAAIPYLKKGLEVFRTILKNPIRFVGNLVNAGIQGFKQFSTNIGTHLKTGLIQWLTGALAGTAVYIPQALEIREIIKFVLSVLGLTWQNIRQKLVLAVGETVVKTMETGFDIVVTLVKEGPAAAWEKIKEQLSNLKEIVLEEIRNFVMVKVVQSAITKLLTSLNPAGALVQAIIAIYNTIMFFIERIKQIIQVAKSFLDSIAAIASGAISAAADRVEQTMAGLLTLVISFLARLVGLGKITDITTNIINKVRVPIDKALDKVVEWIVAGAKKLGKMAKDAGGAIVGWWKKRSSFSTPKGAKHEFFFKGTEAKPIPWIASENPGEAHARINRWKRDADSADATPAMKASKPKLEEASKLDAALKKAAQEKKDEPNKMSGELEKLIAELLDTFETHFSESPEPAKVGEVEVKPVITYRTGAVRIGNKSSMAGYHMIYEYLAPNHGQGTSPKDSEQAEVFSVLPTVGKIGKGRYGGETYIKGHLLNDNVGGPGIAKNLFPITTQANSDHKTQVETHVKNLVNKAGCLAFYEVKVIEKAAEALKDVKNDSGEQMYKIDARLEVLLDTYILVEKKRLERRRKDPKRFTINSVYRVGSTPKEESKKKAEERKMTKAEFEREVNDAAKMTDFDPSKVKWSEAYYERRKR
ncbi:MAG: DUF4157 domain-containing protein [Geobacter sp.]|nr:DUF4157 domain-containing protein [Geobacter sp.]